jgi:hypothetical protein
LVRLLPCCALRLYPKATMKLTIVNSGATFIVAACFLSGCGQSSSNSNDTAQKSTPAAPPASESQPVTSPAPTAVPAADTTPAPSPAPVSAAVDNSTPATTPPPVATPESATTASDALAAPVSQFAAAAAAQPDKQAASIASELTDKAKSLAASAAGNPSLKAGVGSALQSLSAGKDSSALGTLYQQAKQANLTPQQTQLVKDVGNLASAYVVQRNFSSVDGAQGDVATIVNSLRKGSITPAVPALQSLAQNATLTPQQKDVLGTLAGQYAPGLKKATDSLKQGLQGLQGLTK